MILKGFKHTKESREKNRLAHLGRKVSEETKRKMSRSHSGIMNHNFGKHLSEETKKKISETKKENPIRYWLGKKRLSLSVEHRKKLSDALKGEKSYKWIKDRKKVLEGINSRTSTESVYWMKQIINKDDYRCFDCGERCKKIQAHHIFQWSEYPRLRFDLNNGITLCVDCHKATTHFERVGIYSNN